MKVFSKDSPEYIANGHYNIDGVEFMSVWTFKRAYDLNNKNKERDTSRNLNEGGELSKACSVKHPSIPERKPAGASYNHVYIYPLEELKDFYGV